MIFSPLSTWLFFIIELQVTPLNRVILGPVKSGSNNNRLAQLYEVISIIL